MLEQKHEANGCISLELSKAFEMKYMIPNPTKRLHYIVFTIPQDEPIFMIYKTRTEPGTGARQMSPIVLAKEVGR